MNLISLIIKKMNLINDDIIFVIDKFLTHKETLNLTSSNRYLRFQFVINYKLCHNINYKRRIYTTAKI